MINKKWSRKELREKKEWEKGCKAMIDDSIEMISFYNKRIALAKALQKLDYKRILSVKR